MVRGPRRATRRLTVVLGVVALGAALVPATPAVSAGAATIARPAGAGPPVPASGMGTQAALDNPRCRHDDPKYGAYGRFDSTELGGASACVKVWKAGADNGGATAPGVTKDKITVVAVIPNDQQKAADPVAPKQRAGSAPSTYQNSLYDYMLPQMRFFETWGRDIEVKFVTSSGNDEAAQRADVLAIKAMKPFAVMVYAQPPAGIPPLDVLESGLAQAKILVIGYAATAREASAQEPYRWNASDSQAGAVNSAEVIGKQLAGKKAQYGGDDVKNKTRTLAVVYDPEATDYAGFTRALAKYKVKVTTPIQLSSATDPSQLQTEVGTAVTKMKAAGVTTVVNFSGYIKDLMNAADKQEWTPEWFYTGVGFADLAILARSYPVTQSKHAFGLSAIPAWAEAEDVTPPEVPYRTKVDPLNWYWGIDAGTDASRTGAPLFTWLLPGIQAAGPNLTAKTFQQGLFALPPRGGAVDDQAYGTLFAWGKGPKLPYNVHAYSGLDFAPVWFDPDTTGPSNGVDYVGKGVDWFPDGGKRYLATTWPTKPIKWFDKVGAIYHFTSVPQIGYVGDCNNCPATGAAGSTEAPSDTAIIFKAGGESASAA
jgi:hypothetical protein